LGSQEENHTPKLLNGITDYQTEIGSYGASKTSEEKLVAGFDVKQDVEEAQYNGTEGAINQQISTGGKDKIVGQQFQHKK
jgi:hypothetical protein